MYKKVVYRYIPQYMDGWTRTRKMEDVYPFLHVTYHMSKDSFI